MNLEVIERDIERTELYTCDEAFLCGSAMELTAIFSVDGYKITDEPGLLTKKLRDEYFNIVYGMKEVYSEWLTPLY